MGDFKDPCFGVQLRAIGSKHRFVDTKKYAHNW